MFEKVKEVILDTLSCEPEQITMEASLVDDLEEIRNSLLDNYLGDSKRVLYAAARFSLTDEELKSIVTVGDIVRLLEEHQ